MRSGGILPKPQYASPALRQAARQVLTLELAVDHSAEALAATVTRVYEALLGQVVKLLGETGAHALLSRSVRLTRTEFPWLAAAAQGPEERLLSRIGLALAGQPPQVGAEAAAAALAALIELLATFIGEGLTARLLEDAWPGRLPDLAQKRKP
jgi:hypothetical protein